MLNRALDDEYFAVFAEKSAPVFATIATTAFPQTYRALFGFCAKTNSLKTAMFECIDSNNPYAFKVLFRCFCEHYLKFIYLWACFTTEKSDRIGTDYYSFCGAVEAKDYVLALSLAEKLVGNQATVDASRIMARLYPEAAKLSSQQLEQASGQFKYRAILRTLAEERFAFVAAERPFLARIIPTYALLSSFVHGGPYSDLEMATFAEPSALQECEHDVEIAVLLSASVFMLTAAAVAREIPEHRHVAQSIHAVVRRMMVGETSETSQETPSK